jgi:hypothetical protein
MHITNDHNTENTASPHSQQVVKKKEHALGNKMIIFRIKITKYERERELAPTGSHMNKQVQVVMVK